MLCSSLVHSYIQVAKKDIYINYTVCLGKSNTSASNTKQVIFRKPLMEGRRGSRINGQHLLSSEYIFSHYFILDLGSYVDRSKFLQIEYIVI